MKKTLTAIIAALTTSVVLAAPAQAAAPTDLSDVRYAVSIGKMAWGNLDYSSQEDICDGWYLMPYVTRDMMAEAMRDNIDRYISVYDSRRAAWRLLKWAC